MRTTEQYTLTMTKAAKVNLDKLASTLGYSRSRIVSLLLENAESAELIAAYQRSVRKEKKP